jgi:uncharacterized protein (TIGR02147 family)
MVSMRKALKRKVLDDAHYEYLSTWYNPVIRELVTDQDWNDNFDALAKAVRPPITAAQAKRAVEVLIECGLITLENGRYIQTSPVVSYDTSTASIAVTNFHREMCKRALEALDSPDRDKRNMTGCTLHISEKTFHLIQDELSRCRARILAMAEIDDNADSVYHLNLHLFPVASSKKTGKKTAPKGRNEKCDSGDQ